MPTSGETEMREGQKFSWKPGLAYGLAVVCLALGFGVGYLLRGSELPRQPASTPNATQPATANPRMGHEPPSLEQMKQIADQQVQPLLDQLNKDPKNKELLLHIAFIYKSAHEFKAAASYFEKTLQIDPKNVSARTEMASCLYYSGDVDGALNELHQSLKYQPNHANSLFNLGMIRWKGKNDPAGAVAAWRQLLKANPNLDKKPIVEHLIAEARQENTPGQARSSSGTKE